MNSYSLMLTAAAEEITRFQENSADAKHFGKEWLDGISARLEHASTVNSGEQVELLIHAIARMTTDSGPDAKDSMPSFCAALDAVQREQKRRRRSP